MGGDIGVWAVMPVLERVARCMAGIVAGASVYFAVLYGTGMRYRDLRAGVL